MTLKECVEYLSSNGYLVTMNKLPYLTKKFYGEVAGKDMGIEVTPTKEVLIHEAVVKPKKTVVLSGDNVADASKINWVSLYTQFILDADISAYHHPPRGTRYPLRMATKPGREAFMKALLEGITYDELLAKTKAYYQSVTEYPKKIENFFVEELWRNNMEEDDGGIIAGPKSVG